MKFFNELLLKFEKPDCRFNGKFCVIDNIFKSRSDFILMLKSDIIGSERPSIFGLQDTPSAEQTVHASIFKEMRGLDYHELEYAESHSRISENFLKLEGREPLISQMFQFNTPV